MDPRILFVDHTGVLGGAELYLLDVARAYKSTSTVFLFEDGPFLDRLEEEQIRTEVVRAPDVVTDVEKESSGPRALAALPSILSLAMEVSSAARNHDLIFANSQKALIVAGVASWWSQTPLIWNLHDMLTDDHFSTFNRWVATRWANWFADHVIVNSEATRDAFVASGGKRSTTGLVYNGIDPSPFDSVSKEEKRAVRRDLDLDPKGPILGIFSRLAPWKGQHVTIQALSEIPDAHLLLVGDCLFEEEDTYKQQLESLSRDLGVRDRVHFLGFRDDIPRLMNAVDLVVHASVSPEPFGRVIVEGMLARTPVVATRAGGAVEIVEDGVTGRLVSPGNAFALANTVRGLLDDEEGRAEMIENAYERARTRFSEHAMLSAVDVQIRRTIAS